MLTKGGLLLNTPGWVLMLSIYDGVQWGHVLSCHVDESVVVVNNVPCTLYLSHDLGWS